MESCKKGPKRRSRHSTKKRSAYRIFFEEKRTEILTCRFKEYDKSNEDPQAQAQRQEMISIPNLTTEINQMWKDLPKKDIDHFHARAKQESKRRRESKNDPQSTVNGPERASGLPTQLEATAVSAYRIFFEEKRMEILNCRIKASDKSNEDPQVQAQRQENISLPNLTTEINQMWKELSKKDIDHFHARAKQESKRRRKAKRDFQGFVNGPERASELPTPLKANAALFEMPLPSQAIDDDLITLSSFDVSSFLEPMMNLIDAPEVTPNDHMNDTYDPTPDHDDETNLPMLTSRPASNRTVLTCDDETKLPILTSRPASNRKELTCDDEMKLPMFTSRPVSKLTELTCDDETKLPMCTGRPVSNQTVITIDDETNIPMFTSRPVSNRMVITIDDETKCPMFTSRQVSNRTEVTTDDETKCPMFTSRPVSNLTELGYTRQQQLSPYLDKSNAGECVEISPDAVAYQHLPGGELAVVMRANTSPAHLHQLQISSMIGKNANLSIHQVGFQPLHILTPAVIPLRQIVPNSPCSFNSPNSQMHSYHVGHDRIRTIDDQVMPFYSRYGHYQLISPTSCLQPLQPRYSSPEAYYTPGIHFNPLHNSAANANEHLHGSDIIITPSRGNKL